jgi:hypothetical protein
VAFAAGDCKWWWEPLSGPQFFWPKKVPFDHAMENYVRVFELQGYRHCADSSFTLGWQKVALYEDEDGEFTHVAIQTDTGEWQSKMGPYEDIRHKTPEALKDKVYGTPKFYLTRRLTLWRKIQKHLTLRYCRSES